MRANFFVYRDMRDPWLREMRHAPDATTDQSAVLAIAVWMLGIARGSAMVRPSSSAGVNHRRSSCSSGAQLAGSPSQRVMSALTALRARFREPLRMEDLAHIAAMSPSAFHREFKALTAQTPLQYQKQLRLLEARRLMLTAAANVETAAFTVGYESPSQFSREYARMFGAPPKRDVGQLREVMGAEAEEGEVLAA